MNRDQWESQASESDLVRLWSHVGQLRRDVPGMLISALFRIGWAEDDRDRLLSACLGPGLVDQGILVDRLAPPDPDPDVVVVTGSARPAPRPGSGFRRPRPREFTEELVVCRPAPGDEGPADPGGPGAGTHRPEEGRCFLFDVRSGVACSVVVTVRLRGRRALRQLEIDYFGTHRPTRREPVAVAELVAAVAHVAGAVAGASTVELIPEQHAPELRGARPARRGLVDLTGDGAGPGVTEDGHPPRT